MPSTVLQDVVALVVASDAVHNAKSAITNRLKSNGAKVVTRLSREVSHVVFERKRSQRTADKDEEMAKITDLYNKLEALPYPPFVVSPLWVEESVANRRRLIENKFVITRPKASFLAAAPSTAATLSDGNKKRKRPADKDKLPPPPKHAAAFDLDPSDWVFSSTQQLNEEHGHVGTETQAVADILAVDLPADEGEEAAEDGGAEEDAADADPNEGGSDEDDLDTPLGVRFARQSGGKGSFGKGSRARARATGRSRLAQASGPGAAANVQGAEEESRGGDPARKAGTRAGVAQRFSVRHLQSHPERPVKLHKGTPLPGAMPHSVQAQKKRTGAIPVPLVQRVESPWSAALPSQEKELSQPGSAGPSNKSLSGRGSLGGPVSKGRPSMGSHGARGGATPWTHLKAVNSRKELPSPWSAPRAWDAKQVEPTSQATPQEEEDEEMMLQGEGQDGNEGGLRDEMDVQENLNGVVEDSEDEDAAGQGTADPQDRPYEALGEENAPANVASPSRTGKNAAQARRQRRKAATLPPVATEEDETGGNGPTEGFIAVTSVTKAMTELCQSAVRRLHGLRLCTSKQEERAMTHLVIGEERRTLKLLLAVANGALLMSPEWVTASIEAGHWLPEGPYLADVRFAHAAQRARSTLTSSSSKLLHQHAIYYHANRGGNGAAHVAALKRLAGALGAESAQVMACTVCVAVGEGLKWPAALPKGVPMVSEEWLLQAAEQFKVPSTKQFLLK